MSRPERKLPPGGREDLPPVPGGRPEGRPREEREILILAPVGRDAELAARALRRDGLVCRRCARLEELIGLLERGAAAVVVTEEAIGAGGYDLLRGWLDGQPSWSALPILILTRPGDGKEVGSREEARLATAHNVTYLERPVSELTLVSAARSMLSGRRRQYEVRDLLAELSRRIRERDEFLAMLGHELRNPLGALRNATHLLTREEIDAAGRDAALRILDRQTRHLHRLLDDLLDVSRITRGKISLRTDEVDLADVIRQAVEVARPQFDERDHELRVHIPEGELRVRGDATRLEQVLNNLLRNAAKYTPQGGHVRVLAGASADGWSEVRVVDDGIGMEPRTLEAIFEPFTQGEGSKEGLGLGLPLARRLVEMHGGELEARSEGRGHGSQFIVRLPPAEVAAATESAAPEESAALEDGATAEDADGSRPAALREAAAPGSGRAPPA